MISGRIIVIGGPREMLKEFPKLTKRAYQAAILLWHQTMLPRHFERTAYGRFHYKRRSPSHERRKRRKYGHQNPLVMSGRLKREVTTRIKITGTSKLAKGALRGPTYLYQFRKDYNQPDKAAEITATTRGEVDQLGQFIDDQMTAALKRVKTRKTLT